MPVMPEYELWKLKYSSAFIFLNRGHMYKALNIFIRGLDLRLCEISLWLPEACHGLAMELPEVNCIQIGFEQQWEKYA
jgi:hypothetical protein